MYLRLNRALCASTALATGLLLGTAALAQSTGSATVEELVVTGSSGPRSLEGIVEQTAPKTKTTIDQDFIARQIPGQTIADSLNVVPGYNFTNNDPYGNSGGNIRLRSFDCARISFQWDGMQLNDSGNYACFTNQVGDSEIISSAEVSQGTTDPDSPTASATGGSLNYRTKVPDKDMGGHVNLQAGSDNYVRAFGEFDTGAVGPWGTRMFIAGSYTDYDKFKGKGDLTKEQFNAKIYQPLRDNGDFVSLAFHYNKNRNNQYFNPNLAQYQQYGYKFDEDQSCTRPTPVAGTIQNENSAPATGPAANTTYPTIVDFLGNIKTNTSCTGYYNTRINPSDTANIRAQFKYHILDNLIFTFDPNFQYVLANGGGFTVVSETDNRLKGAAGPTSVGRDLNGDGDTLDSIALYTPNNTNTRRYGINSSLIWDINETQHIRLAYSLDYARHRQTAEYSPYDADLNPLNVFAGKDGHGPKVPTNDGSFLRGRDRFSIAQLNMFAAEYFGRFMDDKVEIRAAIRAPYFKRELNQFCYSQNGQNSFLCTTQPIATTLANGNVTFAGNTNNYVKPYSKTVKYDKLLPNVGATYRFSDQHSVYASYAKGFSVPRTDNLYTVTNIGGVITNPGVQPEETDTVDIGYRYNSANLQFTAAVYKTKFKNRIASSFDQTLNTFVDRNIGDADIQGVDVGVVWQATEVVNYIGNISYNDSEAKDNSPLSGGNFLPIKGKKIVETPEWQSFNRVTWDITDAISAAVQMKYVGSRFSTDVNDQKAKAYTTWDADVRFKLPYWGGDKVYFQANVKNLTDEKYLGSINSTTNSIALPGSGALQPTYVPGSPRTYQFSLHIDF
jgi:iron complex outermembrane receptor protein